MVALSSRPGGHPEPFHPLPLALAYAARGWRVFPLRPGAKEPMGTSVPNGCLDATTDPEQIRAWWTGSPMCNIGIATGPGSDLLVLDEDTYAGGDAAPLTLLPTLTAQTARGGYHHYYATAEALPGPVNGFGPHLDARCYHNYVVAPGSRVRGRCYTWVDEAQPVAALPERLAAAVRPPTVAEHAPTPTITSGAGRYGVQQCGLYWLNHYLPQASEGNRNTSGALLAQQLRDSGLTEDEAAEWMLSYAESVPGSGYTLREARATLRSIYKRPARPPAQSAAKRSGRVARSRSKPAVTIPPPSQPPPGGTPSGSAHGSLRPVYELTEVGNADRLIARFGPNFRFTLTHEYITWDQGVWITNNGLQMQDWAVAVVRALYAEAAEVAAQAAKAQTRAEAERLGDEAQALLSWAKRSQTARVIEAMLTLARSDERVRCEVTVFDTHPYLFNCANGTVDLLTGDLLPHRREDYLTQQSPIAYNPGAQAPRFQQFLREIFCTRDGVTDEALLAYMQRVLGHCLTGDVVAEEWYVLVGEGENGKGKLMDAISYVLGDSECPHGYAHAMQSDSLIASRFPRDGSAPSEDMAALRGKRLVSASETQDGARLDIARIKQLTGGDPVTARKIRASQFTFKPTFKLFLYTNHAPVSTETLHAFWRRTRIIPFNLNLAEHHIQRDDQLLDKLKAEAEGILAWLVQGCLLWHREGRPLPPESVSAATSAYRSAQDVLGQFVRDRCVVHPSCRVSKRALYQAYEQWCEDSGEHPWSKRRLSDALQKAYPRLDTATIVGYDDWIGIGLKTDEEAPH